MRRAHALAVAFITVVVTLAASLAVGYPGLGDSARRWASEHFNSC